MLLFLIYLAGVVENFKEMLLVYIVVVTVALLPIGIIAFDYPFSDGAKLAQSWFKKIGISVIIASLTFSIIPSSKTIYTLAAIKYGQEIVEKPEVKELTSKVFKILNSKLDEFVPESKK